MQNFRFILVFYFVLFSNPGWLYLSKLGCYLLNLFPKAPCLFPPMSQGRELQVVPSLKAMAINPVCGVVEFSVFIGPHIRISLHIYSPIQQTFPPITAGSFPPFMCRSISQEKTSPLTQNEHHFFIQLEWSAIVAEQDTSCILNVLAHSHERKSFCCATRMTLLLLQGRFPPLFCTTNSDIYIPSSCISKK